MNTTIFIPKIINVGYRNRSDTYTGRLAYVVYTDSKGVLRKEASWNGWRDNSIEPSEFENVPTSGFVLNKKAGDYSDGWNPRQAYCRVYDPRNFEFEITIENLLYILENANSIKGKGLEGEFVYGWDGKDLVLMPVDSPDYKEIAEYSQIVHNNENIKAKDLILGATYMTKDKTELIYMGKHEYYSYGYKWEENGECKMSRYMNDIPARKDYSYAAPMLHYIPYKAIENYPYGKYFWFAYKYYDYNWVNGEIVYKNTFKWEFITKKSIPPNMFIACTNDKCSQEYADIYEALQSQCSFSPYDPARNVICDMSLEEFLNLGAERDSMGQIKWYRDFHFVSTYKNGSIKTYKVNSCTGADKGKFIIAECVKNYHPYHNNRSDVIFDKIELKDVYEIMKPKYIQAYLANGREFERKYIYEQE